MLKLQSEYDDLDKYENEDEDICYYKKYTDKLHNPYGPAFIRNNGYKEYYINGKLHRLDGPALIYPSGTEYYYINSVNLGDSKQEFFENIKYLDSKPTNKKNKIDILNIKNFLLHGLDSSSLNILKSLL